MTFKSSFYRIIETFRKNTRKGKMPYGYMLPLEKEFSKKMGVSEPADVSWVTESQSGNHYCLTRRGRDWSQAKYYFLYF
jgi:hypothetical protein